MATEAIYLLGVPSNSVPNAARSVALKNRADQS
jgi:hypothetical protein